MSSPKPRSRIFYGWWVVFACAVIQFYIGGTFYQGFSALFNPIASEFDWSYAAISLALGFPGLRGRFHGPNRGDHVGQVRPEKIDARRHRPGPIRFLVLQPGGIPLDLLRGVFIFSPGSQLRPALERLYLSSLSLSAPFPTRRICPKSIVSLPP